MEPRSSKQETLARLRSSIEALESGASSSFDASSLSSRRSRRGSGSFDQPDECAESFGSVDSFGAAEPALGQRSASGESASDSGALPEDEKTADDAYRQILRWVSVRERSTTYLHDRLLKAEYSEEAVAEALERACRVYVVDDRRYADALVRMKLAAGKGLREAAREIEALGIDPSSLDAWQEHEAQGREAEVERALAVLVRRPPRAKQRREAAFRRLVSQGYSSDVAATAARLWTERQ